MCQQTPLHAPPRYHTRESHYKLVCRAPARLEHQKNGKKTKIDAIIIPAKPLGIQDSDVATSSNTASISLVCTVTRRGTPRQFLGFLSVAVSPTFTGGEDYCAAVQMAQFDWRGVHLTANLEPPNPERLCPKAVTDVQRLARAGFYHATLAALVGASTRHCQISYMQYKNMQSDREQTMPSSSTGTALREGKWQQSTRTLPQFSSCLGFN